MRRRSLLHMRRIALRPSTPIAYMHTHILQHTYCIHTHTHITAHLLHTYTHTYCTYDILRLRRSIWHTCIHAAHTAQHTCIHVVHTAQHTSRKCIWHLASGYMAYSKWIYCTYTHTHTRRSTRPGLAYT